MCHQCNTRFTDCTWSDSGVGHAHARAEATRPRAVKKGAGYRVARSHERTTRVQYVRFWCFAVHSVAAAARAAVGGDAAVS